MDLVRIHEVRYLTTGNALTTHGWVPAEKEEVVAPRMCVQCGILWPLSSIAFTWRSTYAAAHPVGDSAVLVQSAPLIRAAEIRSTLV